RDPATTWIGPVARASRCGHLSLAVFSARVPNCASRRCRWPCWGAVDRCEGLDSLWLHSISVDHCKEQSKNNERGRTSSRRFLSTTVGRSLRCGFSGAAFIRVHAGWPRRGPCAILADTLL